MAEWLDIRIARTARSRRLNIAANLYWDRPDHCVMSFTQSLNVDASARITGEAVRLALAGFRVVDWSAMDQPTLWG